MRAFLFKTAFGLDNLSLADVPQPAPGHGQVLVKMKAWSLNYRDLMIARDVHTQTRKPPFQPLSDGAGEVVEVGAGVTRVKTGDRVAGAFMQRWVEGGPSAEKARSALGGAIAGVASEFVVFDGEGLVPIPPHLSYEEAATLPCAAVTAWHALVSQGKLAAGDTILVQGTGGVSIFALQFARMHGARVIATSSSNDKLERVRSLGVHDLINYKETPRWGRRVRELTDGVGVDHVVEVGGAGTLAQSLEAVRTGGRISLIGVLTEGQVDPVPILMNNVTVQGIYVGSREMFEAMNRAITLHGMKPIIGRIFPFAQLPQAMRYMESGAHFGKVVLNA